jgi:hypothetical protein
MLYPFELRALASNLNHFILLASARARTQLCEAH